MVSNYNVNRHTLLFVFSVSGATSLIYEMLWVRPLSLVFGTTTYAIGIILASFILGLGIGSWLGGKFEHKIKNPLKVFALIQLGIGFYGILLFQLFPQLQYVYLQLYNISPSQEVFFLMQLLLSMALVIPPTILMGATLPIMVKEYIKHVTSVGKAVGRMDGVNSMGAFVGILIVTFILIPNLGIQTSLYITAIANIILGVIILGSNKFISKKKIATIASIAILIMILAPPIDSQMLNLGLYVYINPDNDDDYIDTLQAQEEIIYYKESMYNTIIVNEIDGVQHLKLNGKPQCGDQPIERMGLKRLALIPLEWYAYNNDLDSLVNSTALNIGHGCGTMSKAMYAVGVQTTTIEIDKEVVEAADKYLTNRIEHTVIIDDARNHLLRNEQKYDVIITEPSPIWQNDSHLFTKEFFELVKSRLSDNGVVGQWLPAYSLDNYGITVFANTFQSVFPYTYVYQMQPGNDGFLILIGSEYPLERNSKISNYLFALHEKDNLDTELNTDDKPILEFNSIDMMYKRELRTFDLLYE